MTPPSFIDGARVIQWAWSDLPFGILDGNVEVHGLAICKYDHSPQIYRFCCDATWECQQDFDYESIEDAKRLLPQQYCGAPALWVSAAPTTP